MIILLVFSFLAGIVTVLSPCILPILPIVLSGAVGGHKKPLGIVLGFVISFTFFTLFLTSIVRVLGVPGDLLRSLSIIVIGGFGVSLLIPGFQAITENVFAKFSQYFPRSSGREGFLGGVIIGLSIGLLWTPCVGPILASVISLALSGTVNSQAILLTFSYSLGTSIPMLLIIYGGQKVIDKVPFLAKNTPAIQKGFGILMIITAVSIYFNFDRRFQSYILDKFPGYGAGLTKIEESSVVFDNLKLLNNINSNEPGNNGQPMNNFLDNKFITAPEIIPGGTWFNTSEASIKNLPELSKKGEALKSLRGKVVLVDFWTYTCINCIRTLPYLRDWHEKYKDYGLVIIGVHTPEFEFEKSAENVQKSISDFGLNYPIVQDNNYETWKAYANRYWPAKYLVDKEGKIRYTHFGEGEYDETEEVIQKLLEENGEKINLKIDNPDYKISTKTPELYLGYERMGYFSDPKQISPDTKKKYVLPNELALHHFSFGGEWVVGEESSGAFTGSSLVLAFESKEVFLVMKPKKSGTSSNVRVYLDDSKIEGEAGEDVKESTLEVTSNRLYKIVKLNSPGKHLLKLEFLDDNCEVFAFTFG